MVPVTLKNVASFCSTIRYASSAEEASIGTGAVAVGMSVVAVEMAEAVVGSAATTVVDTSEDGALSGCFAQLPNSASASKAERKAHSVRRIESIEDTLSNVKEK